MREITIGRQNRAPGSTFNALSKNNLSLKIKQNGALEV